MRLSLTYLYTQHLHNRYSFLWEGIEGTLDLLIFFNRHMETESFLKFRKIDFP